MSSPNQLTGQVCAPGYSLPTWAQDHLTLTLWDRDAGPDRAIVGGPVTGPDGRFTLPLPDEAALQMAMVGHGEGPQHIVSVGWGADSNPALAELPWQDDGQLGWDGTVRLTGFVEQLHLLEWGGMPLSVLEVVGHTLPHTYRRLPPLPLPPLGDRHGLNTTIRHLEDSPEQVWYALADPDSPLAALTQDALVSSLRVVAYCSLGEYDAYWHDLVNVPLVLDSLTLIGP